MPTQKFIVPTLAEVAAFFGVAPQTAKQWRSGPDGMPGDVGGYDLAQIVKWRIERERQAGRQSREGSNKEKLEEAKLAIDVQMRQTRLKRLTCQLVDVEAVGGLFERAIHEHNAQADQLKDRILLLLPDAMSDGERKRVIAGIDRAIDDLRQHLADASETWARESSQT